MMRCHEASERASDLIDGNLSRSEAMRLRMHLLICKGCARFVRQMRATRYLTEVAGRTEEPESDADVLDAILKRAARGGMR